MEAEDFKVPEEELAPKPQRRKARKAKKQKASRALGYEQISGGGKPAEFNLQIGQQQEGQAKLDVAENMRVSVPAQAELALKSERKITAQDLLDKEAAELKALALDSKRETHKTAQDLKILTAIMLGKDKNRELAQMLDTDKSFAAKQVKDLEERGLIKKEANGREVKYSVDRFNLLKFLQARVVVKWGARPSEKDEAEQSQAKQSSANPRGKAASEEKEDGEGQEN